MEAAVCRRRIARAAEGFRVRVLFIHD